jgi:hypothetical protein
MSDTKVHDLQARYREIAADPYEFTWADRTWKLPSMRSLDYRIQGQIEGYTSIGIAELEGLFNRIMGKDQAEAWADVDVPSDFLMMLFGEWTEFSGAQQGESPASSNSSANTGTSSRRTSGGATGSGSPKRSTGKRAPRKAVSPPASSST